MFDYRFYRSLTRNLKLTSHRDVPPRLCRHQWFRLSFTDAIYWHWCILLQNNHPLGKFSSAHVAYATSAIQAEIRQCTHRLINDHIALF